MGSKYDLTYNNQPEDKKKSKIDEIQNTADTLFKRLMVSSDVFDCNEFINKLVIYIDNNERIYYSVLSGIIYKLNDETIGTINTNLDKLVEYLYTDEFIKDYSSLDKKDVIEKTVLKLWDHSHLAHSQVNDLNRDDFYEKFYPEKEFIENEIREEGHKLNKELIAMVAIFTAMSFLVFGGLKSLSDVLGASIEKLPLLNTSIVCLLWGLCVYNLIYLFMYLISKIIDKNIFSRSFGNLFRRHNVYFIGNAVLLFMIFVTSWLYFANCDFKGWYSSLEKIFGVFTPFLPLIFALLIVAVIFVAILFIKLFRTIKNKVLNCYYINKYQQKVIITSDAVYDDEWNWLQDR